MSPASPNFVLYPKYADENWNIKHMLLDVTETDTVYPDHQIISITTALQHFQDHDAVPTQAALPWLMALCTDEQIDALFDLYEHWDCRTGDEPNNPSPQQKRQLLLMGYQP